MPVAVDAASATKALITPKPTARPSVKAEPREAFEHHLKKQQKVSTDPKPTDQAKPGDTKKAETNKTEEPKSEKTDKKPVKKKDGKADIAAKKSDEHSDDTTEKTDGDPAAKPAVPTKPRATDEPADDAADEKPVVKKEDHESADAASIVAKQPDAAAQSIAVAAVTAAATNPETTIKKDGEPSATSKDVGAIDATQSKSQPTAKQTTPATPQEAAIPAKPDGPAVKPVKADTAEAAVAATDVPNDKPDADAKAPATPSLLTIDPTDAAQQAAGSKQPTPNAPVLPVVAQAPVTPQRQVVENNIERIVTSVRGELLSKGGSMQIRLDPPTLGTINIQVNVNDGVLTASLQTENEQATRMLSHNLTELKSTLESAGISVDRIQVKQAPANESSSKQQQNPDQDRQQQSAQDHPARQEQQRREMLQRMWRKLSMGDDPLDMVA